VKEFAIVYAVATVPLLIGIIFDLEVTSLSLIWHFVALVSILMWQREAYKIKK